MIAEEHLSEHDNPEVEGRFVGIGFSLVGEGEEVAFAQRLVGDAQVAEFVRGGEVAQNHDWHQGQQKGESENEDSILFHVRFEKRG